MCIYIFFWIAFRFRSPQSTEQHSLCCTVGSYQLSILYFYTYQHIYVNPNLPIHPTPYILPWCPLFFPLCPCLYLCFANRISRFCMYVLIYGICFSLSDLLHSVSDSLFTWSLLFSLTCVLKVINIHLKLSPALKFPYFMLNSPISHLHSQLYHPQGKSQKELSEERIEQKIPRGFFFFFASCFEMTAHFIRNLQKHRNVQNRKQLT